MRTFADKVYSFTLKCSIIGLIVFVITLLLMIGGLEDEFYILLLISHPVTVISFMIFISIFISRKLDSPVPNIPEPRWFTRLAAISLLPNSGILLFGAYSSVEGISFLFSTDYGIEGFVTGAAVAMIILIVIPVLPIADLFLALYAYRYIRRKKLQTPPNLNS